MPGVSLAAPAPQKPPWRVCWRRSPSVRDGEIGLSVTIEVRDGDARRGGPDPEMTRPSRIRRSESSLQGKQSGKKQPEAPHDCGSQAVTRGNHLGTCALREKSRGHCVVRHDLAMVRILLKFATNSQRINAKSAPCRELVLQSSLLGCSQPAASK